MENMECNSSLAEIEPVSKLITVSYPLIYPLAFAFKIFGSGIIVARGTMVFLLWDSSSFPIFSPEDSLVFPYALGTVALLSTFAPLYGNGKSVLGEGSPGFFSNAFPFKFGKPYLMKRNPVWDSFLPVICRFMYFHKTNFLLFAPASGSGDFYQMA